MFGKPCSGAMWINLRPLARMCNGYLFGGINWLLPLILIEAPARRVPRRYHSRWTVSNGFDVDLDAMRNR